MERVPALVSPFFLLFLLQIGLLTRLYDKVEGLIKIDGVDVENIGVRELRKTIGIVQQEPCLFNGTIRENIVLGRNVSGEKVEEAARIANAHEFIMKLQDVSLSIPEKSGIFRVTRQSSG